MKQLIVGLAVLFTLTPAAHAGGMFYGVRCGIGPSPAEAATALNGKLEKLDGYAGTVHSDLRMLPVSGGKTLACVAVNRRGHMNQPDDYKSEVLCASRSATDWAKDADGYYLGNTRHGLLTSLQLLKGEDDTVTACALAQALPKEDTQ